MMTEYIVNVDDMVPSYFAHFSEEPETVFGHRLREKIVRCGDCKFLQLRTAILPPMVCGRLGYINCFAVKPEGFCAWGEPRGDVR